MGVRTLVEALLDPADRRASRTALITPSRRVRYDELARIVASGAQRLRDHGVKRGDRVLLRVPNSVEFVGAYYSIHSAGAVAVPTDTDTSPARLRAIVDDCQPALFVSDLSALELPFLSAASFAEGDRVSGAPLPDLSDDADILYTTGTTGRPKGVVLTHRNIASAALNIASFLEQRPDDVEVVPVPFSHSFGLGRIRCMALIGNAVIPVAGMRNLAALLDTLVTEQATGLAMVPAGMALLRRIRRDLGSAVSTLRYLELCGAPIDSDLRAWVLDVLPSVRVFHTYGLTEASRAAFVDLRQNHVRHGSIGRPSPNVEIELRADDGRVVTEGTEGEIWVRGEMVMREYWRRDDLTKAAVVDGWLKTGDIASADSHGNIVLSGRLSDTINVGGMKVAPVEVEELLARYPGIIEVACAGTPDPNGISGERVKAFVVAETDLVTADVLSWLQRQGLEPYKMPIAVERIASLPRTSSGKIMRYVLAKTSKASAPPDA